jgi:hypothetical protein
MLTLKEPHMRKRYVAIAVAAALVVAAGMTAPAFARRGGGSANASAHAGFSSTGLPPGFTHGQKHGWNGGTTPPGWTGHGKKTGWGTGTMPPGLSGH